MTDSSPMVNRAFFIDPDIKKARTLPAEFYTDPQYFELSKEKIFARSWQLAAGPELEKTLTPLTLLPKLLSEPLLLVKEADRVGCLSNVCTHRGKILVDEPCSPGLIRCGYHGRRFSLDGKFLSMPEFDGVHDFPSETDNLTRIETAELGGFVFVSLDPVCPFEVYLEGTAQQFASAEGRELKLAYSRDYEVKAHWALYCENYLEGFHIPYVHRGLNEIVDYGSYATETFQFTSLQAGYDNCGEVAGRYLFMFPNLMFNFYSWGLSVNIVLPSSPSRTTVKFLTYVRKGEAITEGAGSDLHNVELEDEAVVESVQRGIMSRYYSRGRYSPTREQGTHHFHRLIAEFLN